MVTFTQFSLPVEVVYQALTVVLEYENSYFESQVSRVTGEDQSARTTIQSAMCSLVKGATLLWHTIDPNREPTSI